MSYARTTEPRSVRTDEMDKEFLRLLQPETAFICNRLDRTRQRDNPLGIA